MPRLPTSLLVLVSLMVVGPVMYGLLFLLQTGRTTDGEILAKLAGPLTAVDPLVLQALRERYLDPPSSLSFSPITHAFFSESKEAFTWPWINHYLKLLFSGQRGGFFVEAGALDGVYLSNTLWLERDLNWTGLLIEPDEANYAALTERHRRAWSSNTCISSETYPKKTIFVSHSRKANSKVLMSPWSHRSHGHELRQDIDQSKHDLTDDMAYSRVQCFPLVSYLVALNVTSVDVLTLDIQGTEVEVITNFLAAPNGVTIRVIVTENEYDNFDDMFLGLMKDRGYVLLAEGKDCVFVRREDPLMQRPEVKFVLQYYATKKLMSTTTTTPNTNVNKTETVMNDVSA